VSVGHTRLSEAVTGLTWTTQTYPADSFAAAQAACGVLVSGAFGGLTDWRVPTLRELAMILSKDASSGVWPIEMVNPANSVWWTSTIDKSNPSTMVALSGNWPWTRSVPTAGGAGPFQGERYTFCVSGAEMAGAWEVIPHDATVAHTTTGLIWHGEASVDQAMSWDAALQYCESSTIGGSSEWRLPTLREYLSVFDLTTTPGFMSEAFAAEPTGLMLTGTPNRIGATTTDIAWVNEDTGGTGQESVGTISGGARCVRGPI
jgi:hypothetical protein